jgi:Transposase zinc-binding domain
MCRPPQEVADLIRAAGAAFIERNRHWISGKHLKVLRAIRRCRTAALGGHLDQCTRCGHRAISYNSCRNRHCPKCQASARDRWLQARCRELLPTRYVHVVFTLPRELAPLALQNKKVVYDYCFAAVRKHSWKLLAIPLISVPKSVSSAYCTPGIRSSGFTLMSIAWFLPAGSPPITPAGSKLVTPSFYLSRYSVASSAANLWRLSSAPFATASWDSTEI